MKHDSGMSTNAGTTQNTVHEAYSFACMKCGHGWEQEYEIAHREYADGKPLVVYYANGERVPSPSPGPPVTIATGTRCGSCAPAPSPRRRPPFRTTE